MADTAQRLTGPITSRMIAGWRDRRGTTRQLIDHGRGEAEALFFVMAAGLVTFVAGIPAAINGVRLSEGGPVDVPGVVTSWMLTCLLATVLFRYILSMLSRWGAKAIGGTGSHLGARYAQFWMALVVSPILFIPGAAHLAALALNSETVYGFAQGMDLGAQLIFLAFWAEALAEAEGFEGRGKALAAIFGPLIILGVVAASFTLVL